MPDVALTEIAIIACILAWVAAAALSNNKSKAVLRAQQHALRRIEGKLDALLAHQRVAFDPSLGVAPAVTEALQRGNVIEAIKRYREATGVDLADAKRYVDDAKRRIGIV